LPTTIYRLADGTRVPSVTTILDAVLAKPALVSWANKLGLQGIRVHEYVDDLADVGAAVHELCKSSLTGRKPNLPPLSPDQLQQATTCFSKFLDWRNTQDVEVLRAEQPLVSESLRYGGTIDVIVRRRQDGVTAIWDFKTGRAVYDDHLFQVSGYAHLARENGYDVTEAWIVRVGRSEDEGFEAVRFGIEKLQLGWAVFKHARAIYDIKRELELGVRRAPA
jgi:hypothetical protein